MLKGKINLADLEKRTGKSYQSLSAILNGHTAPRANMFVLIAKALEVDIVELFCTEEQSRILREHQADVATFRQEVADLRKVIEEQVTDLKKRMEETQHKSAAAEAPRKEATVRPRRVTGFDRPARDAPKKGRSRHR